MNRQSAVHAAPWVLGLTSVLFAAALAVSLVAGRTGLAGLWAVALALELVAFAASIRRLRRDW